MTSTTCLKSSYFTLALIITLSTLLTSSNGLRCFECYESNTIPGNLGTLPLCGNLDTGLIKTCYPNATSCIKADVSASDLNFVLRMCGVKAEEGTCNFINQGAVALRSLTITGDCFACKDVDGCNVSSVLTINLILIIIGLLSFIIR